MTVKFYDTNETFEIKQVIQFDSPAKFKRALRKLTNPHIYVFRIGDITLGLHRQYGFYFSRAYAIEDGVMYAYAGGGQSDFDNKINYREHYTQEKFINRRRDRAKKEIAELETIGVVKFINREDR